MIKTHDLFLMWVRHWFSNVRHGCSFPPKGIFRTYILSSASKQQVFIYLDKLVFKLTLWCGMYIDAAMWYACWCSIIVFKIKFIHYLYLLLLWQHVFSLILHALILRALKLQRFWCKYKHVWYLHQIFQVWNLHLVRFRSDCQL